MIAGERVSTPSIRTTVISPWCVFALGCGLAALLFMQFGVWCFAIPPILAGLSLIVRVVGPADQ